MEDSAMGEDMPEPSLLDNSMEANIDDLFGEAADGLGTDALGVPLPPAPIPPELGLRIADMQSRGCCTKLAWSSTGSVAQIKDRGRKIVFRALIRSKKTGLWPLSEESKYAIAASDNARWEHIQFSNMGTDLAVVDSLGYVYVHTLIGPLGKMPLAPHSINRTESPRSDSDAVVGLHWLIVYPAEFKFPYITPATKVGEKWSARMELRNPGQPSVHHAVESRSALLYVSRDTRLTLMYQIEAVWHAVDVKLEDINSSEELLSHAAMGEDGDAILLVTHDLSRRFRLYRVSISWNPTPQPRPGGQQPITIVAPTLSVRRLTVLDHVVPQHADAARLSQLRIVSAVPPHVIDLNSPTLPTVLAIFTRVSLPVDLAQQHQEAFSIIARWHVESAVPTLHEAFSKLKTNGTSAVSQSPVTSLRRHEDIVTNKIVMSIEPQYFNTMLAFPASDGTIEFRERTTMTSIEPYPDPTTVTSLPQSGFEHLIDQYYVHVAMSTDGSALVMTTSDGTLSHKNMTLRYTWHPVMDDGLIEAAIICLARQYAILCSSSVANDETLALLPLDLSVEMRCFFIKEVISLLGRTPYLDISMQDANRQQMTTIREGIVPKALSAQFVLGCKPGTTQITFMGKFAFAFLNMRLVATSLMQLATKPEAFVKPDFLISLRGLIRWGAELFVYISSTIATVRQNLHAQPGKSVKESFDDLILDRDSPVVYLLFSTSARAFIRFLGSVIPKYLNGVQKVIGSARSVTERQQLTEIFETGTALPFKYTEFETFIADIDTAIRNIYTHGQVTAERRVEIELSMLCCDHPLPDELEPVLQTLLDTMLPKFLEKVDLSKLYFWDTSWLGIDPSPNAHQLRCDLIRKVPLTKDMKLKTCRRCGGLSEDMSIERTRELAPILVYLGKYCICANYWVVD